MSKLEDMDLDKLHNNIIRRKIVIGCLRAAVGAMKAGTNDLINIDTDLCHFTTDRHIRDEYKNIIYQVEKLVYKINEGDWCFSADNTREFENKLKSDS